MMQKYQVEGKGPAANIVKALLDAGFDIGNERDMQMGMIAYNSALVIWQSYKNRMGTIRSSVSAGRNDSCPCGSGQKYKKCCLRTLSAASDNQSAGNPIIPFGPSLIPRLASSALLREEFSAISKMMCRDEVLRTVRFDTAKIEAFMVKDCEDGGPTRYDDDRELDNAAFRYANQTGETKLLKGLQRKFTDAAPRARTAEELRGLAAGSFFALVYDSQPGIDNPLTAMIFRLSLENVVRPIQALQQIIEKLGDEDAVRKEILEGSPTLRSNFQTALDSLGADDKKALYKFADEAQNNLWATIDAGTFPVSLPIATMIPVLLKLTAASKKGAFSAKILAQAVDETIKVIGDEDRKLYGRLLDKWLSENVDGDITLRKAIELVSTMTKVGHLSPMTPSWRELIMYTLRHSNAGSILDDDERQMIESGMQPDDPEFLKKYAHWLESRGYPGLARRTTALAEPRDRRKFRLFRQRAAADNQQTSSP